MKAPKLSRRLQTVAGQIPNGAVIADIGSDHASLPCHTCLQGITPWAVASEVAKGPLQAAHNQIRLAGLVGMISVRQGDGLEVIHRGEVDVVVIAGMGGNLMVDILDADKDRLCGISRLVLQPNVKEKAVRFWLLQHDWELIDEVIIEDVGKTYEVLIAEPGVGRAPYTASIERELMAGPFLMKKKSPAFLRKWQRRILKKKQIYAELQNASPSKRAEEKIQNLLQQILDMEEMLK